MENSKRSCLLHLSTQIGERTNATTSNWRPNVTFEALGANHSEFNDHPGTRNILDQIFDVAIPQVPGFFNTP